jgi:Cu/Ag efflux protein CusF
MKTMLFRWQPLLAVITVTLVLALPVEAARLRHHSAVPRRLPAVQTETFSVASDVKIAVGSSHSASLSDLRIGDQVSIGYIQENGARVARHIADGVTPNASNPGKSSVPKTQTHAGMPALTHAHGVVQSVDIQAGTLTIAHKRR